MTVRRLLILGALASCSLLAAGADARADYTYVTGLVTASPANPAGLGETITSLTSTITPSVPAGAFFVNLTYAPTATVTNASQTLSWTETITDVSTGSVGTFAISGTLTITSAVPTAVAANFINVSIVPTTSGPFSLAYTGYAPEVANGLSANLGFIITPTAIPEPTSMALLGTGLVGVVGLGLRRSRTKAKV